MSWMSTRAELRAAGQPYAVRCGGPRARSHVTAVKAGSRPLDMAHAALTATDDMVPGRGPAAPVAPGASHRGRCERAVFSTLAVLAFVPVTERRRVFRAVGRPGLLIAIAESGFAVLGDDAANLGEEHADIDRTAADDDRDYVL
jgi:hypothetical protein